MAKRNSKDKPWIVLQCGSCGGKFKLNKDQPIRGVLACPSCSEEVDLDDETRAQLTFEDELISQANPAVDAEDRDGASQPGNLDVEFKSKLKSTGDVDEGASRGDGVSSVVEDDDGDVPEGMVRKRRKVRKRKRKSETLDWDGDSDSEDAESEEGEDGEEWTHTVGIERDEDGNIMEHRRKTKKRKDQSKVLTGLSATAKTVGIVVAIFVVGAATLTLLKLLSTDGRPQIGGEVQVEGVVTPDLKDLAFESLERYLRAATVEERLQLVRRPKRVEPFLRDQFSEFDPPRPGGTQAAKVQEFERTAFVKRAYIRCDDDMERSDFFFAGVTLTPSYNTQIFALEYRDGKMLVDWEASYGHGLEELAEFQRMHDPSTSADFRCTLSIDNFYGHAFDDDEKYACFRLTFPQGSAIERGASGGTPLKFYGYVRKKSPLATRLQRLFIGGEGENIRTELNAVLRLKYPAEFSLSDQVEITEILNDSWFYPDPASGYASSATE